MNGRLVTWLMIMMAAAINVQAQDEWTELAPSEQPRVESAAAVFDGKVYGFAGFKPNFLITGRTDAYDPSTNSWTAYRPMPRQVTHAGATVVDNTAWIVGGFEGDDPGRALDVAQIYNFDENLWYAGPPLPERRASGALVMLGRKLHHIGGLTSNRQTDVSDHYVLDLDNQYAGWFKAAPLPSARNHLSAVVYGGRIYVIGGQFGHDVSRDITKLVHVYDPSTDSWSRAQDMPAIRSHAEASTFVHGRMIYVVGGMSRERSFGSAVNSIVRYDPATDEWAEFDELPERLVGPIARVIDSNLYVLFGGVDRPIDASNRAWSKPLLEEHPDTLGFWPKTVGGSVRDGSAEITDVILWTADAEVPYELEVASGSSWLTLVSPPEGTVRPSGSEVSLHVNTTELEQGTHIGSLRATAPGFQSVTLQVEIQVEARPTSAYLATNGHVAFEAEGYHERRANLTHDWVSTDLYGSVASAVEALPNRGTMIGEDYVSHSPALRYVVSLEETGTYYVWVRGWGQDGDADSWYVGLDAIGAKTADRMTLTERQQWPPKWTWSNATMEDGPATLDINEPGTHIVNVWMREDGLLLDRMLLTTDSSYVPSGSGPAPSSMISISSDETNTSSERGETPSGFQLEANYPNPFNPSTTIRYSLPTASNVVLTVYDVLGHQVARLVDQMQGAGSYEVSFDGAHLPSGMYLYKLEADAFTQHRQMTMIK